MTFVEYLSYRPLGKPGLMAEQKCYLVLHCLALHWVSFGPLPVVVNLHPSVSVIFVLVVF